MKKKIASLFGLLLAFSLFPSVAHAQKTFKDPGSYMNYINEQMKDMTADLWDYSAAIAHGKTARKIEKRRTDLLSTCENVKKTISKMPDYSGDGALRDSVVSFLALSYNVLNYDYAKIVDMEDIAEQSYDAMEAYMLAQEKAGDKLKASNDMLEQESKNFAARHNVTLVDNTKDQTAKKLETAGKVFDYHKDVYLIFFKSYKQEAYMLTAMNNNDMGSIQQNGDALSKTSTQGKALLDSIKAYNGDGSIKTACKELLTFYNDEATKKLSIIVDGLTKKENFEKIKAAFDAKPAANRTKADVDEYNKAATDYNTAMASFNKTNQDLNTKRQMLIDKWNNASQSFLDRQVPKYK